ncbi:MAG: hypothetical protein AAGC95_07300 [Pseudomonadota bacterium]
MTENSPVSLKFKLSAGRIVLSAFFLIITALAFRIWDANRNVATFAFTIEENHITYDAKRLGLFRNAPPERKIIESISRKNTIIFVSGANNKTFIFKDIAGKITWISGFGFVSLYSTHVTLDPKDNRVEGVWFNPQSEKLSLVEALELSARIRDWFLVEGFEYSPPSNKPRFNEPKLELGSASFFDTTGAIHPKIRPSLAETTKIENMFEHGFWAFRAQRGDIYMSVKVNFVAPHREAPETPLENYGTSVRISIADTATY